MSKIVEEIQDVVRKISKSHPWSSGDLLTGWLETEINPELNKYGIGLHRMNKFERLSEAKKAEIPGTIEWVQRLRELNEEPDKSLSPDEWSDELSRKGRDFIVEIERRQQNPNPVPTREGMMLYLLNQPDRGVPVVQKILDTSRKAIEYPQNLSWKEFYRDDRNITYSLFYAERTVDENRKLPLDSRICFSTFQDLEYSLPFWIEDHTNGETQRVYREMPSVLKPCIDDLCRLIDTLKHIPALKMGRENPPKTEE